MATVTLYRCVVPHFQGDLHVPIGALYPDGPQTAGDLRQFFVAEEHTVDTTKAAKKADA